MSIEISNSEIENFLRCRRKWSFENRMQLRPIAPTPHMAFHVGSAVHAALEAQISLGHRPNVGAIIEQAEQELEDYYTTVVGTGWSNSERELLTDSRSMILGLTNHYFNYWGAENPLAPDYKYVCAEVTFKVPIPNTEHFFAGTIDGIAKHIETGEIYLVEHKTTGTTFPDADELLISRQLQAYVWAAGKLLGKPVAGIIYDGMLKKVPQVPNLTQKGELSRAAIITTQEIYLKAIEVCGFDPKDYAETLAKIKEHKFFQRHTIRFPKKSLEVFEGQLAAIATDMANPDLPLYPNRVWQGCWDCPFGELCVATQMGEDTSSFMKYKYRKAASSPTRSKYPVSTLNLEDLNVGR